MFNDCSSGTLRIHSALMPVIFCLPFRPSHFTSFNPGSQSWKFVCFSSLWPLIRKILNGDISATGHPIHFMFGSCVSFSGKADRMPLFLFRSYPRWRHEIGSGLISEEKVAYHYQVWCHSRQCYWTSDVFNIYQWPDCTSQSVQH